MGVSTFPAWANNIPFTNVAGNAVLFQQVALEGIRIPCKSSEAACQLQAQNTTPSAVSGSF